MEGLLLTTVEGLEPSPFILGSGDVWQKLQAEKEQVIGELNLETTLYAPEPADLPRDEASVAYAQEIEWQHRGQLEARLRDLNDAQDRLMNGDYGRCVDCGEPIESQRLTANQAASRCIVCQTSCENELRLDEHNRRGSIH
jgi:DnaK suppressor protein